jgi:hypothetical protein
MNVEQAREIFHEANERLFAVTEQLQIPHTTVCQAVKVSYIVQVYLCVLTPASGFKGNILA